MNIVLLGPSGVGKGTHATALAERFHLRHLATGDLFRTHLKNRTALGRLASRYLAQAELVPDEVVEAMVDEWGDALPAGQGTLFDGFPRTADQVRFLEQLLQRLGRELTAVVYLKATDDIILGRLAGRLICRDCQAPWHARHHVPRVPGRCDACGGEIQPRPDDTAALAERRLRTFHRTTEPVLRHYAALGKVVIVPGDGAIATVGEALHATFKALLDHSAHFATPEEVSALAPPRPLLPPPRAVTTLDLVLLGGPGSGKGTQAERLGDKLHLPHIATGDLFREHLHQATPLGRMARTYMDRGELVPDDVTEAMVEERLARPDTRDGFILDGFPRTLPQAEALAEILGRLGRRVGGVLYINVSDAAIIERLSGRLICRGCQAPYHRVFNPPQTAGTCDRCGGPLYTRDDDRAETVSARLVTFHRQTEPLIEYYRQAGLLHEVPGEGSVADISAQALALVSKLQARPEPHHTPAHV